MRPSSLAELASICRDPGPFRIVGSDTKAAIRPPAAGGASLELSGIEGIVEWEPDDQVVVVRAGTRCEELQTELESRGQCLPLEGFGEGTVGGSLSINESGRWRDWVLGMTVVLADGTIARCGSKAVKNVAGYDVQKLFIGARGTLGVVAEAILRTYPVSVFDGADSAQAEDLRLQGPDARRPTPDATLLRFMKRAKAIFDPTNKLNPGEFGFL